MKNSCHIILWNLGDGKICCVVKTEFYDKIMENNNRFVPVMCWTLLAARDVKSDVVPAIEHSEYCPDTTLWKSAPTPLKFGVCAFRQFV